MTPKFLTYSFTSTFFLMLPLLVLTLALDTATLSITGCGAIDVVEGQLAVRIDIVVALVKEHRHAAAGLATVLDDSFGQRLDLVAWHPASTLKEGANAAPAGEWIDADFTVDAHNVLAVLVPTAVGDVGGNLLAKAVGNALVWVVGVVEKGTVG